MYKKFEDRMNWYTKRFSIEKFLSVLLGFVSAILFCIFIWSSFDLTPATVDDYAELYKKLESAQGKPEYFFRDDGEIKISDGIITCEISNRECKMIGRYNQDFELIETIKTDTSFSIFKCVIVIIVGFCLAGLGAGGFVYLVIGLIEFIVIPIKELVLKIK